MFHRIYAIRQFLMFGFDPFERERRVTKKNERNENHEEKNNMFAIQVKPFDLFMPNA